MHRFHVHTPKISRARLVCLGNKARGYPHGLFHVLLIQRFLGLFGDFLFNDVFGFAFDTSRDNPAFNPRKVLLGSFKGFRVLLRPWNPPRTTSLIKPLPY